MVVSKSSAIPLAILPIILAVAGAIRNKSAFLASEICLTSKLSGGLNKLLSTGLWVIDLKVRGLINSVADSVIITSTFAPNLISRLATSTILYAATPPLIPKTIFLSIFMPPISTYKIILYYRHYFFYKLFYLFGFPINFLIQVLLFFFP